jgi:hypothetical protein
VFTLDISAYATRILLLGARSHVLAEVPYMLATILLHVSRGIRSLGHIYLFFVIIVDCIIQVHSSELLSWTQVTLMCAFPQAVHPPLS